MSEKKQKGMTEGEKNLFVRIADCFKIHVIAEERMHKFDMALYGEDGRNGIVKDITDIKSDIAVIKSATGAIRQILMPVFASLVTAGIMYLIFRA